MRKFRHGAFGGIQQKTFILVLCAMLLVVAVYTLVMFWQTSDLRALVAQTNAEQKQAITSTVEDAMNDRLTQDLGSTTQMEAYIADDMFSNLTTAITMMADFTTKLYENPDAYPAREVALPDASTDGDRPCSS